MLVLTRLKKAILWNIHPIKYAEVIPSPAFHFVYTNKCLLRYSCERELFIRSQIQLFKYRNWTGKTEQLRMQYSCYKSSKGGKFSVNIKVNSLLDKTMLPVTNKLIRLAHRNFETALFSASPPLSSYFSSIKIVFLSWSGWKAVFLRALCKEFRLVMLAE